MQPKSRQSGLHEEALAWGVSVFVSADGGMR
jgi:hypothetical protein